MKHTLSKFSAFSCVGKPSLKKSTGVTTIAYRDEKNNYVELIKKFDDSSNGREDAYE